MTADELMVGTSTGSKIIFAEECSPTPRLKRVEVEMIERDWDVSDPDVRYEKAVEEYPPLKDLHPDAAQIFIDPDRNASALCIYRPSGMYLVPR